MKNYGKSIFFILFTFFGLLCFSNYGYSFGLSDLLNFSESNDKNINRAKKAFQIGKKGSKAFSDISEEQQYYIGRSVGALLLGKYQLSNDMELWNYVSGIGQTLALASGRPETFKGYHFIVLDEPNKVNAFSVPSGFIFISTGLIAKANDEDELAGALAHEVSHIVYGHPTDSIKKVYKDQIKKDILAFAAEEVSASQKTQIMKELVKGLNQVSGILVDSAARGYSRDKENEADLMAAQIMVDAGYDPRALASVLKKLKPIGKRGKSGTHGNPKKRSKSVLKFVKQLESHPEIKESRSRRFKETLAHIQ
jgi:predicted Zn-dependent protease